VPYTYKTRGKILKDQKLMFPEKNKPAFAVNISEQFLASYNKKEEYERKKEDKSFSPEP